MSGVSSNSHPILLSLKISILSLFPNSVVLKNSHYIYIAFLPLVYTIPIHHWWTLLQLHRKPVRCANCAPPPLIWLPNPVWMLPSRTIPGIISCKLRSLENRLRDRNCWAGITSENTLRNNNCGEGWVIGWGRGRIGHKAVSTEASVVHTRAQAGVASQHCPQLWLGIWAFMSLQWADIGFKLLWKCVWPWVTLFLQLRAISGEHWEFRALRASVGRVTWWHICAPGKETADLVSLLSCYLFFYFSELVWGICLKWLE